MPDRLSKKLIEHMTAPMFSVSKIANSQGTVCLTIWTEQLGNIPLSLILKRHELHRLQEKLDSVYTN